MSLAGLGWRTVDQAEWFCSHSVSVFDPSAHTERTVRQEGISPRCATYGLYSETCQQLWGNKNSFLTQSDVTDDVRSIRFRSACAKSLLLTSETVRVKPLA